jgi:hypothetical protein
MQQFPTSAAVRAFPNLIAMARRRPPAAKKLFQRGELPAEFFALLEKLFERYRPSNLSEAHAVADAVRAAWFYLRHWRTRETFETKLRRQPDSANWTQADSESLAAFTEYHHRARRSLLRALKQPSPCSQKDSASAQSASRRAGFLPRVAFAIYGPL